MKTKQTEEPRAGEDDAENIYVLCIFGVASGTFSRSPSTPHSQQEWGTASTLSIGTQPQCPHLTQDHPHPGLSAHAMGETETRGRAGAAQELCVLDPESCELASPGPTWSRSCREGGRRCSHRQDHRAELSAMAQMCPQHPPPRDSSMSPQREARQWTLPDHSPHHAQVSSLPGIPDPTYPCLPGAPGGGTYKSSHGPVQLRSRHAINHTYPRPAMHMMSMRAGVLEEQTGNAC